MIRYRHVSKALVFGALLSLPGQTDAQRKSADADLALSVTPAGQLGLGVSLRF